MKKVKFDVIKFITILKNNHKQGKTSTAIAYAIIGSLSITGSLALSNSEIAPLLDAYKYEIGVSAVTTVLTLLFGVKK